VPGTADRRLGEALALEVKDVDAGRMLLHIRAGKGNKAWP